MPSKTSFFNTTLYKKLLSRFWPMWLGITALASLAPLITLLELMHLTDIQHWYMGSIYTSILATGGPAFMLVYSILAAMAVWGYLYSPRSVSLMHTLPMTRTCLFVTGCAAGLSFLLLPVVIAGALLFLVGLFFGIAAPLAFFQSGLGLICLAVLYFGFATLCAMVTGSLLALPVFYAVGNFLAVLLDLLLANFTSSFFFGVNAAYSGAVEWLSPTVYIYNNVAAKTVFISDDVRQCTIQGYHILFLYCLAGALLLAVSWALYRCRSSESAGDVVSFRFLRPLFKFVVALLAAFSFGQVLYLLFTAVSVSGASLVRMGVCMTVAGAVGFWIADMLVQKSLRVWRTTVAGAGIMAVVALVICLAVRFDVFGIEDRIPDRADIVRVDINADVSYLGTLTFTPDADPEAVDQILALHRKILDDKDFIRQICDHYYYDRYYDRGPLGEETSLLYCRLAYELKDGSQLTRIYTLPISRSLLADANSYAAALDALVNSPASRLRQVYYGQGYAPTWGYINVPQDEMDMENWSDSDWERYNDICDLSSDEAAVLYAALAEDAQAGRWGQKDLMGGRGIEGSGSTVSNGGNVSFELELRPSAAVPDTEEPWSRDYARIFIAYAPEMTATRQALLDLGVPPAVLKPEEPALGGGSEIVD